jgi:cytidylate kinase
VVAAAEAHEKLVIAVDGPAGSGKSTAARAVAGRLGLRYLDTGAMYRALTWWMLERGVPVEDPAAVAAVVGEPELGCGTDPAAPTITVDGADVARQIRSRRVTSAVSAVSAVPEVRARLVDLQHAVIDAGGIVVEGRDIGTVVVPDAPVKVFLTAVPAVRAQRRAAETAAEQAVEATRTEMASRDAADSSRVVSPLRPAPDAICIDTTDLTLSQVVERIVALATAAVGTGAR